METSSEHSKVLLSEAKHEEQPNPNTSIIDCFRFASVTDNMLLLFGLVLSFLNGAAFAFFALVVGLAFSTFDVRYTEEEVRTLSFQSTIYMLAVGVSIFVGTLGSRTLLRINAQRQGYNLRKAYFSSLLRQEISFYDKINPMEFTSQVEADCRDVAEALDSQLESIFNSLGGLICAITIAFVRSWEIALIVLAAVPFILGSMYLHHNAIDKAAMQQATAYSKAGAIAEEALTQIKTVVSLGGEKAELKKYNDAVTKTQEALAKAGIFQGVAIGCAELVFFGLLAVVFYIGCRFIHNGRINPSTGQLYLAVDIFTPVSAIYNSFSLLPVLGASLAGLNMAKIKARKILDIIAKNQSSNVSTNQNRGKFNGSISFKDVCFAYPSRPEKSILTNLSFDIEANTKVAFVGDSGSGKSTIIQLLQKFYEPRAGKIKFDGCDSQDLDISWIRKHIAYVGQEPVLFSMTIRDNLLLSNEDATEDQLWLALKKANAYDFVMGLDNKLDTFIGGGAMTQLSGGQKQRIAIARAILRDAKVLLLDEATSALDRMSEKEIQATLDSLQEERTIIIVAHRLSTIQEADQIIVLNQGQVEEVGRHQELMEKKGKYYSLQAAQAGVKEEPKEIGRPVQQAMHFEEDKEEFDEEESHLLGGQGRKSALSNKSEGLSVKSEKGKKEGLSFNDFKKFWSHAKLAKKYFALGLVGSFGNALIVPFTNITMCGALTTLVQHDEATLIERITLFSGLMFASGVLILIMYTTEFTFFAKGSETMVQTLRQQVFYKFMRMHMGWHDDPQNNAGHLASTLELDTANVGQLAGTSIGLLIQMIGTNIVTVAIGLVASWQLGIIGMFIVPVVLICAIKLNSNQSSGEEHSRELLAKAETLISEAINNIKTVTSLEAQERFLSQYCTMIKNYQQFRLSSKVKNGLIEGGMYLILYIDLAGMYYLGTHLFFTLNLSPFRIFLTVFGIALTCLYSTQLIFILPDTGKAVRSAQNLLRYLNMSSKIDIEDNRSNFKGKIEGNIEFKDVKFSYPTRRLEIFNNLNLKIQAGKQVGITGLSGCGKSTIIQLLLRFYDVDAGEILIEGVNIKKYDLRYLRKNIGVVFQEPVLFYGTIEYNLKYANEEVTESEMIEAVKKANALKFIEEGLEKDESDKPLSMPSTNNTIGAEGFQRLVGSQGSQISGGQKQRIAIARAILRNPKILLLDEATSALDSNSEAKVQEALTNVSRGLTTISVAHRFSTLKELSEILVLKEGEIVEKGPYDQLIEQKGHFYQLKEGAVEY